MNAEPEFRKQMEQAEPASPAELKSLEKEFGFKYRQGIGELLYAMVTCRPDISFPVVKLSQYSVSPARIHFEAIQKLYLYLKATKTEGIYYWRKEHRMDLPPGERPTFKTDANYTR